MSALEHEAARAVGRYLGGVIALMLAAFAVMLAAGAALHATLGYGAALLVVLAVRGLAIAWKGSAK